MRHPLAVLAGLIVLAGCRPPLYVTGAVPTPLVAERGELQLNGALALEGLSALIVYAPVAPLSVFALGDVEGLLDTNDYRRTRAEGSGGLGLFAPLGAGWHAEVLGGVTVGSVETEGTQVSGGTFIVPTTEPVLERADLRRSFVQLNVGRRFTADRAGAVGFSARVERAEFLGYVIEREGRAPTDLAGTFAVPSFFGRFGRGPVLGTATLSYAVPLEALPFEADGVRFSMGIQLRLDELLAPVEP